jgi:hypothetical protein
VFYLVSGLIACQSNKVRGSFESKTICYTTMSIKELHDALNNKDFLLVNVHISYAGEIPGTDLFIPYNKIEQNLDKLPLNSARIFMKEECLIRLNEELRD